MVKQTRAVAVKLARLLGSRNEEVAAQLADQIVAHALNLVAEQRFLHWRELLRSRP